MLVPDSYVASVSSVDPQRALDFTIYPTGSIIKSKDENTEIAKPYEDNDLGHALNDIITAGDAAVSVRNGSYSILTQVNLPNNVSLDLNCGSRVLVDSSLSIPINSTAKTWGPGDLGGKWVLIKNLILSHKTSTNSDIGLQLQYIYACLRNIRVKNVTGRRQGTGIKTGPKQGALQSDLTDITSIDYETSFDLSADHVVASNLSAIRPITDGIFLHSCGWVTMINPYVLFASPSSANGIHFDDQGMTTVIGPGFEGPREQTGLLFHATNMNVNMPVIVYDLQAYENGFKVTDDNGSIKHYYSTKYKGFNQGLFVFMASGQKSIAIPHGLFAIPRFCIAVNRSPGMPAISWLTSDASSITVNFDSPLPSSGTFQVGWYSSVST
jgi:hypothetical protein